MSLGFKRLMSFGTTFLLTLIGIQGLNWYTGN